MLVSCVKDNGNDSPSLEEPGTEEQKPVEESKPEIIFKLGCDWAEGDAIGIYAFDAESKDLVFGNKKLTFNGSGWAGDKLCWEKDSLKFYAYYPYDENIADPAAISFNVKEDQSGENEYRLSGFLLESICLRTVMLQPCRGLRFECCGRESVQPLIAGGLQAF